MLTTRMTRNHHMGTFLYFFISLVCISIFVFPPKALLLCFHRSLYVKSENELSFQKTLTRAYIVKNWHFAPNRSYFTETNDIKRNLMKGNPVS